MKSNKLNILVLLLCGVIIIGFVFFSSGAENLARNFSSLDVRWVLAAILCMVLYWFLEAFILHILIKPLHKTQKFRDTVSVSMSGQYFNSVTPFASGGQPFQAYVLKKQGVELGVAINGLLSKFVLWQASLVVVSAVMLVLRLGYFRQNVSNFTFVVLVGFGVELGVMAAVLGMALFPDVMRRLSRWIIRALAKLRLVKNRDEKIAYMDNELIKFKTCFKHMLKDIPLLIVGFLLNALQLLAYMAVPYMIYRAFNLNEIDPLTIIAAQSFVMMVSSYIPIPGAGVGAEGFFYYFFQQFFRADGQVGVALILWRVITFYFTVLVGAFFTVQANKSKPREPQPHTEDT